MTKRMIDADVLSKKLEELANFIKDAYTGVSYKVLEVKDAIQVINDFATTAPEPQESIFNAKGWCWDINKFKNYYSDNGFLIKTEYGYTTIRCGEQYRLRLKDFIAWRPLPNPPKCQS